MKFSKLFFIFFCLFYSYLLKAEELILADAGRSDYVIIADSNAEKLDRLALKEFTTYFKKSSGVTLPLGNIDHPHKIFIGVTPAAERLLGAERLAALAEDESLITCLGKDLFLVGGGRFGTVYAVYTFLENQLGIRWYDITGGEKVPPRRKLAISPLNYTSKPHFPYRMLTTSEYHWHPNAPQFLFRNRINMIWGNYKREGAEELDVRLTVNTPMGHTMHMYITPDKNSNPYNWKWQENKEYFSTNPEFFGLDKDGQRSTRLQLCFSNNELRKEFTRRFKERIDLTKHNLYHIGASDWPGKFCLCPGCQALEEKYACIAGPLLDYILELSEEVKDSHPQVSIGVSAYRKGQTEVPPTADIKFPDNVYIKFCPIDDDTTKNYLHANNADTYKNLLRWNDLAKNVWVWYYPCYGGAPSADFERTCLDTMLMAKAGCVGMCFEHDVGVHAGLGFTDMMTWVLTQVYQKPDADWKKLVSEFAEFYYGKAAPQMLVYLFELQKLRTQCPDFTLYDGKVQIHYSDEQIAGWENIFEQMEQSVADDPLALAHVQDARIDLDFLLLQRWNKFAESSFPYSAQELHDRIRRNIDSSFARRYPTTEKIGDYWRKPLLERLERNLLMAAKANKPLPPEFAAIPEERIQQTVPPSTSYAKSVPHPDAAFGVAMRDPKKRLEMPFTLGFHDQFNKKSLLKMALNKEDIHIDQFHLYKMGTVTISQKCRLWLMQTWSAHVQLENFHRVGFPDKKWDLYVSLKFEGPGYGESQAEENNVWMDRVVLVELEANH